MAFVYVIGLYNSSADGACLNTCAKNVCYPQSCVSGKEVSDSCLYIYIYIGGGVVSAYDWNVGRN